MQARSGSPIEVAILNNECTIPYEVLNEKSFELRVFAYEVVNDELVLRYSPTYERLYTIAGSYIEGGVEPTPITPTEFEQYMQAMTEGLNEVANVDIDASKSGSTATVTITNRHGVEKTVEIYDGEQGPQGPQRTCWSKSVKIGQNGNDGKDGVDGYSPVATVTSTQSGATISITDKNGTTTANVVNGTDGQDGQNGQDGYSPVATVTSTAGGATISITDKTGTTAANISNGTNGTNGADGYTPVRGTDYWTAADISYIEAYCANYIDQNITQAIGGSY